MTSGLDPAAIARHAASMLGERALRPPRWRPEPHQVPPEGDWYGWLLLAGRGAGKTDACAHYVAEHVKGPPCLRGPVPHWIGIIAPTLGDAVTACYAGPSGIRTHSPDAKLRLSAGGTVIQWPNGSEAKLFGASNPEDVERLRAGGNRSLAGDTLVDTEHGLQRLDEVMPGQRVWTRNGLRTVLAVHEHGVKPLWKITTSDGRVLRATADHKIWTGTEWCRVDEIRTGGNVATWQSITSRTRAFDGINSQPVTTPTHDVDSYTGTSGSSTTDRFQQRCTFITSITTSETTTSATWRHLSLNSTHVIIPGETYRSVIAEPDWYRRKLSAAYARRINDRSVTASVITAADGSKTRTLTLDTVMLTYTGALERRYERAPSAQSSTKFLKAARPSSAVRVAGWSLSGERERITQHTPIECAACAEHSFGETFDRKLELAHPTVRCVKPIVCEKTGTATSEPVYDITVEHDHEFFANGILVSNCLNWLEEMAAWRYLQACWEQMRFGLRSGPRPHWIASTTPKPRPLIKKLAKETPHNVVVTRASTDNNPHLDQSIRSALYEEYGGLQIGRQELHAEVLEEDAAALWTREVLERTRVGVRGKPDVPETFTRLTVGVDPSGGAGEQGIVVVGRASIATVDERGRPTRHSEGFVLADKTVCLNPHGWSRAAVRAAIEYEADDIVVERNYGGAMAFSTILDACDGLGVSIPVREVTASRGKRVRAEPVSALTVRDRWHLAGHFPELEDQLCTWTPDADYSPDRLDAMVWPAWHMGLVSVRSRGIGRLPLATFAETSLT